MPRTVYALLVGINDYPNPYELDGCIADVRSIDEYLRGWVNTNQGYQVDPLVLTDRAATRQGIIDGFRTHLGRARGEDVALFYFCGHGSQTPAPEQFRPTTPSGLMETLVCYDSRRGGWDLADKELALLIDEVARKDPDNPPHIVVILDCCHSGSGTRAAGHDSKTRRISTLQGPRPAEMFLAAPTAAGSRGESGWALGGSGRHVLLAACRNDEEAREGSDEGEQQGVFSHCLLNVLRQASGPLTYRDLLNQTSASVRSKVSGQSPQCEVTDSRDLHAVFLAGSLRPRPTYFNVMHDPDGWILDAGRIHGIRQPADGETTVFALLAPDVDPAQVTDLSSAVGEAEVVQVLPDRCRLLVTDLKGLSTDTTYRAVAAALPLARFVVRLDGEEAGLILLRAALRQASVALLVREASATEAANYRVLAREGGYSIIRSVDDQFLTVPVAGYTPTSAALVASRLEHIARWLNIADLPENPGAVHQNDVEMTLLQDGRELPGPDVVLTYRGEEKPQATVRLKNTCGERRYCALLGLSERFAVASILESGTGVVTLDPNQEYTHKLFGSVNGEAWQQGVTEEKDVLKLIVSRHELNARELEQEDLERPVSRTRAIKEQSPPKGLLQRLVRRVGLRGLSGRDDVPEEWCTRSVTFTTVRPLPAQAVPPPGGLLRLLRQVEMAGHSAFRGQVRLTTLSATVRSLGAAAVPAILRRTPEVTPPLQFSPTTGSAPVVSALELTAPPEAFAQVSPENPLRLILSVNLQPGEHVLPIGYDGQLFLPAGRAVPGQDGRTEVRLERLFPEKTRGSTDAARILLYKFVGRPLQLPYPYPVLARPEWTPTGEVLYETDVALKERIAHQSVKRILLFVHGMAGTSRDLVPSEAAMAPLAKNYDLVLTFDYESIHTTIEETALKLGERLREVGLGANHRKELHIVAHGIGGLVARWFIERDGGNEVVQHLVMLGTPNAGSPWPSWQHGLAWSYFGLSLLLNMVGLWPIGGIGSLLCGLEAVDVTFDQTQPGSSLLQVLADSSDPRVRYTVLAGNTNLIETPTFRFPAGKNSLVEQILERGNPQWYLHKGALLVFFGQPNDLYVSVKSCHDISPQRNPAPDLHEVACDHLSYLTPTGYEELAGILERSVLVRRQQTPTR
jgi:pimeloyl-ACP methyl ester carboxylesterase